MTKRKKIVIEIAVVFFVVLGLLTYFADKIDHFLLPQVKTCEPVIDYSSNKYWKYFLTECYIPKSSVVFDGEQATVYAVRESYYDETAPTVYSIAIKIKDSDELYYTIDLGDNMFSVTSTTQLVYNTSKPLSDGDRVFIAEEN